MNRKRNVNYVKPEDPEFLKVLKRQAGYDDRNPKFDEVQTDNEDFVDDGESEKPQVVVLKEGDLTAEEAEAEKIKFDKQESEKKADLNQRILFTAKLKTTEPETNKRKRKNEGTICSKEKQTRQLLSFNDEDEDDTESS